MEPSHISFPLVLGRFCRKRVIGLYPGTQLNFPIDDGISWDPQGARWILYDGGFFPRVLAYPSLTDLAHDTNGTEIGEWAIS